MATLRDGCSMPVHGEIKPADTKHPRYGEYLRYRSAMTAQLVYCPSFENWLREADAER